MNTIYAPEYDKWATDTRLPKWGKIRCQYCNALIQGFVLHRGTSGVMIFGEHEGCPKSPVPGVITSPCTRLTLEYDSR